MTDKKKADLYLSYLERILAGDNDIGPVEDVEIEKLLLLAKTLMAAELSIDYKVREDLRKKLLTQLTAKNKNLSLPELSSNDDDELDEEALNHVAAAGFTKHGEQQKGICPRCGSAFNIFTGKCLHCNK